MGGYCINCKNMPPVVLSCVIENGIFGIILSEIKWLLSIDIVGFIEDER